MKLEESLVTITEIFQKLMLVQKEKLLGQEDLGEISINQCQYIDCIKSLGHPTFSQLAGSLDITKASVTAAVNKLIKGGLVDKMQSSHDKRVYNLYLTDKGKSVVKAEQKAKELFVDNIKKCLTTAEVEQLEKLFEKIIEGFPQCG